MKKLSKSLLMLLLSLILLLAACDLDFLNNDDDIAANEYADKLPEEDDRMSLTKPVNPAAPSDVDGESIEDMHDSTPQQGLSLIISSVTSAEMRAFESQHAVSAEQERYLAFGAFVMTNNLESIRVFALDGSADSAVRILRDSWNVEDKESALVQLKRLSSANGQAPVANDIYNTVILNGYLKPLETTDVIILLAHGGFEHLYENTTTRAENMTDEFDVWVELLEEDLGKVDRDEAFMLFISILMTERINRGLEAYTNAKRLLISQFGYTEEELLNLPSLNAWDYGRVAIIARYGTESGYLKEDEAWQYLKLAADSASQNYSSWREYTAAHILGRALAFGNTSADFRNTLEFLLKHPESSFQTIDFKG
ncbi:MAG: DUF1266 domain-containing protein [Oscillospiraceae bacterium]|jgi:outer membrane lipopolysaccharide assembly protein LptE/RlpB|nr:DUF1266 domain-containing protein [Oscillospiraceae bacterium]